MLLAHLREMVRTYEVTLYAYSLMSNHAHLLIQAPKVEALGRPLRWFMTDTARAFHRTRGRWGRFRERRIVLRIWLGNGLGRQAPGLADGVEGDAAGRTVHC